MKNQKLNEMLKGIYDDLTDEQKEKAKACKTIDELTALLGEMGIALPDELLDAAAGGLGQTWGTWQDFPVYPGSPAMNRPTIRRRARKIRRWIISSDLSAKTQSGKR